MMYVGIDPTAGRRPLNYAVLDEQLRIVAEGSGKPEDLLTLIAPFPEVICAVDAPILPNAGLMASGKWRAHFNLPPEGKTWSQYRVCEYELRRRGINLYATPATSADAPGWIRAGWALYERLRQAGFLAYPAESPRLMFEVHPHATFTVLLDCVPYKKDTLEGRLQRQLLLNDEGVNVEDAMQVFEEITRHHILRGTLNLDGLRWHDELDALAAALTAYYVHAHPNDITPLGDAAEGFLIVPTAALKDRY